MPEISMAQTEDFNWHGWFQLSFGEVGAEGEGGGEEREKRERKWETDSTERVIVR